MVTEAIAPSQPSAATRPLTVAVVGATGLVGGTMIGVLGEYVAKMLSEAKQRPTYFVAEHRISRATAAGVLRKTG